MCGRARARLINDLPHYKDWASTCSALTNLRPPFSRYSFCKDYKYFLNFSSTWYPHKSSDGAARWRPRDSRDFLSGCTPLAVEDPSSLQDGDCHYFVPARMGCLFRPLRHKVNSLLCRIRSWGLTVTPARGPYRVLLSAVRWTQVFDEVLLLLPRHLQDEATGLGPAVITPLAELWLITLTIKYILLIYFME